MKTGTLMAIGMAATAMVYAGMIAVGLGLLYFAVRLAKMAWMS